MVTVTCRGLARGICCGHLGRVGPDSNPSTDTALDQLLCSPGVAEAHTEPSSCKCPPHRVSQRVLSYFLPRGIFRSADKAGIVWPAPGVICGRVSFLNQRQWKSCFRVCGPGSQGSPAVNHGESYSGSPRAAPSVQLCSFHPS